MTFTNVYEDAQRAEAYAQLEFPGTYYLTENPKSQIPKRKIRNPKSKTRSRRREGQEEKSKIEK